MMGHTMYLADFRLDDFRAALEKSGAVTEPPTNEWEILRYRLAGTFCNAYRNAKGKVTLCGKRTPIHYDNFVNGREIDGPPQVHVPKKPVSAAKIAKVEAKRSRSFTLYTDASLLIRSQSGAWAAILVTPDGGEHEAHGQLKGEINSSTSAEVRAIANGLHHFIAKGLIPRKAFVRIVTDNVGAVAHINGRKKGRGKSAQVNEAAKHIAEMARSRRIYLSAEWIKGHQLAADAIHDPRIKYNRRCDKLAGQHSAALHAERKAA